MSPYRRLPYALASLLLFFIEVLIATKLNHWHIVRAYVGDILVVILMYTTLKAIYPFASKPLAVGLLVFAGAVEGAQYWQMADRLQLTGVARIVFGTSFSVYDLFMYALGAGLAYYLDHWFVNRTGSPA